MNKYTAIAVILSPGLWYFNLFKKMKTPFMNLLKPHLKCPFNHGAAHLLLMTIFNGLVIGLKKIMIYAVHVKLTDTADAVSRILAEKTAGRNKDGSVDLIWGNGENFASFKRNGLLRDDAWAFNLPSWRYTDPEKLPA